MALSFLIRKAASSSGVAVTLRAISTFAGQLHVSSSISTALNAAEHRQHGLLSRRYFAQSHQFSTVAVPKEMIDISLLKALKSEIKNALNSCIELKVPFIPSSFPFKVEVNPKERTATSTREFPDGTIKVMIKLPEQFELTEKFGGISDDDSDDDDCSRSDEVKEEAAAPSFSIILTLEKKGQNLKVEILCSDDRVTVQNIILNQDSVEDTLPKLDNLPKKNRALVYFWIVDALHKFMFCKLLDDED